MSNFLALATVTAALQLHLGDAVSAAVPGAQVWVDRSDVKRQTAGVNVYLYRTSYEAATRNEELPARRSGGGLRSRPRAATVLHYLLTFHGRDDELVPQRLLGATLAALHTRPVLSRPLLEQVVAAATDAPPVHDYLATSDLADAEAVVRVAPEQLELEDLSKLWSSFFQAPYQLSATYAASTVLVEEQGGAVVPGPPVLHRQLEVRALLRPRVLRAGHATEPGAPVVADSVLLLEGTGLHGEDTRVRVGGAELLPVAPATAGALRVDLSAATGLRPGLQPVTVRHRWLVGSPAQPRGGELSNALPVPVSPRITASVDGGALTVTSDLPVGPRQSAAVELLVPSSGAGARLLDAPERSADTSSLVVPLAGVPAGSYGVVLHVDGAASPLTRDAGGTITSPVVAVP